MTGARLRLGVDFGTSTTIAMLQRADGRVQPLLFDGSPLMSSAVLLGPDGRLHTGRDAAHLARSAPERLEPNPKRRIDDTSVLLGDAEVSVKDLVVAVLSRVAHEAGRVAGPVRDLALTHPANWGQGRRAVLVDAARQLGFTNVELVGEPTAAATYFAHTRGASLPVGACVLVYDLGAGTCDVTLLRRQPQGFEPVASDGLNDVGGLDVDAAVIGFLQATYGELWTSPATRRQLWDDVRSAKEMLSRASGTVVMVPALGKEVPLGREQLEGLARPVLRQTIAMTRALVLESGVPMAAIAGLFLVGGSSRIPLVATLLHEALGIAPVVAEQPELVVAEGSLYVHSAPGAAQPVSAAPVSPSGPFSSAVPISGQFPAPAQVSPGGPAAPVSPSGPYSAASPVSANPAYLSPPGGPQMAPNGGPQMGPSGAPQLGRMGPPAAPYGPPSAPPFGPPPMAPRPPLPTQPSPRKRSGALVALLAVVGVLVLGGGALTAAHFLNTKKDNGTPNGGGPSATGADAAGGKGKYDPAKLPKALCDSVDAGQLMAGLENEKSKPDSRTFPNTSLTYEQCQISRSHDNAADTTKGRFGTVTFLVYVGDDVKLIKNTHETERGNAKNGAPDSIKAVSGLGDDAFTYETHLSAEADKQMLWMTLSTLDSNSHWSISITFSRYDAAGWTDGEKKDLRDKLIASGQATVAKVMPSAKR